jgi:hypothetical protein
MTYDTEQHLHSPSPPLEGSLDSQSGVTATAEHALSQVTFYTSKMEQTDFEGMSLSLSSGGGCYVGRGESGTKKYRTVFYFCMSVFVFPGKKQEQDENGYSFVGT